MNIIPNTPYAHASPGGLDREGCHVCRTDCGKHGLDQGERHCHQKAPVKLESLATVQAAQASSDEDVRTSAAPDLLFILFVVAVMFIFLRFRNKPGKPVRKP